MTAEDISTLVKTNKANLYREHNTMNEINDNKLNENESQHKWDAFFMSIALVTSLKSKDTNTKVGAVLVDNEQHIIGTGYNGFPRGIDDDALPMERTGEWLDTKYPYVVHAELNCIINSIMSAKGSSMYCTLFPCNECAKALIQAGVRRIVYLWDKHHDDDAYKASRKLLSMAGIIIEQIDESAVSGFIRLQNLSPYL